jgi:predicted helicase
MDATSYVLARTTSDVGFGDSMSQLLINRYLADLDRLRRTSGATRESVVREAFKDMLKAWGRSLDLQFVAEHEYITPAKERRYIDGALLHDLRVPFGYWEAKDTSDKLDDEIAKKLRRGYPQTNIIFEDSARVVLIQNGGEVVRCAVDDVENLHKLLTLFFGYQRPEIADFRKAITQFKVDLPSVLAALRQRIDDAYTHHKPFSAAASAFLRHAREAINPSITDADVREMLIQHILTEDIFVRVFGESDFHRENNVAKSLYALERLFFRGDVKQQTLHALEPYYAAIRSAAALIESHSEKQGFLKAIYENFYKVYNPKAADRLGVVYTPDDIVRFMIEAADQLCERHFHKNLIDRNVEILDPATGTGTFMVQLLEYFRGRPAAMKYKYLNEMHANEVAILPYYVANLNIEATYAAIKDEYEEYPNLCFVDTLDNVVALKAQKGQHFGDLLGGVSEENVARIKKQNTKKISVVIGNPPYNANQLNENENNKNREYPEIDRRIKRSYIHASTAQKTKLYDMYVRFFRWASDRIEDNGIVAFVSNSSFIDGRTFDGFRKIVAKDFNDIWIVDLKGNARTSGERRRREGGNIFDDQIRVGVAVYFCVKKQGAEGCRIHYRAAPDYAKSDEKLDFLRASTLDVDQFVQIIPDENHNWINLTDNDFSELIPLANNGTKETNVKGQENAIFKLFGNGVNTARDEWVVDPSKDEVEQRVRYFLTIYNQQSASTSDYDPRIKWSRNLKLKLARGKKEPFDKTSIVPYAYRPFAKEYVYLSDLLIDEIGQLHAFSGGKNRYLTFSKGLEFRCLATTIAPDFHFLGETRMIGRNRFLSGRVVDNITDWALTQFASHYGAKSSITKDAIFAYVYGVLHDPIYREKYAQNLQREFPRIPLYPNFSRWRDWGDKLLDLHVGYEKAEPFPLIRVDRPKARLRSDEQSPRVWLKPDQENRTIILDDDTKLTGVPPSAWDYKLGSRSAMEWVMEQHREKTPRDEVIREKFDNYHFSAYKERVIDLLRRVVSVSVDTMDIVDQMRKAGR